MSALLDELRNKGCDIDGAMGRFLNKEDFYARCYKKFLKDPSFAALGEALQTNNVEDAFRYAHTIKGVVANMGLTPLFDMAVEIVEPLRRNEYTPDIDAKYAKLMDEMKEYAAVAERLGL